MTKKLLIDTNVFVDYLMGEIRAKEFLEQLPEGIFYYSPLTRIELLSARICADTSVRMATSAVLSTGKKVELDDTTANLAAEIKRQHNLPVPDSVLAAAAIQLKAELVTKNVGEFKKIKELLLMKPY